MTSTGEMIRTKVQRCVLLQLYVYLDYVSAPRTLYDSNEEVCIL